MAGSIRQRSKKSWEINVDVGRDPVTGRRRRRFLTVRGSRKDAERALAAAVHERDTGIDIIPGKLTVAGFLERWMRDYASNKVAASTLERYQQLIDHHLNPGIGGILLRDLRPPHIQAMYSSLSRHDGREGCLSAKSIKHVHSLLREALGWAVHWQLLSRNPADAAAAPSAPRPEMRVLNEEEVGRFLDAARDTPYFSLFYVTLATGARIGEVLALRWSTLDLTDGTMQITRTQRYFKGKGIVTGPPKTHRSRRPVALSGETVRVLRDHRREQLEHRVKVGPGYDADADIVFANALGGPLYDSTVRRAFYGVVKAAGLDGLRIHDLRHTSITLMLRQGVGALAVSQRVGHVDVAFTLSRYGHVLEDESRAAAQALDSVLVGNLSAKGR